MILGLGGYKPLGITGYPESMDILDDPGIGMILGSDSGMWSPDPRIIPGCQSILGVLGYSGSWMYSPDLRIIPGCLSILGIQGYSERGL